jgi:RNA polymerase sigma-70 factor (ECF subfamily)
MAEPDSFHDLIQRVRQGEADAAEELWRRFEPTLRREVRLRLRDPRLRRLFDETDVCQSVMASFFVRAAAGQFDLEGPQQLQGLLVQMGRNKLHGKARRHQAQRRDYRRVQQLPANGTGAVGAEPTPSQAVAWGELLQQFRDRLDEEERRIADLRAQGHSWPEIGQLLGGSADARRVQLTRAVTRVSRELGLDVADDE